jgi:PEP-CTERM motif
MRSRHLMSAILFVAFATPALLAGPTFGISAGPPPGQGGEFGSVNYNGPNNFSGELGSLSSPPGLYGFDTPLNSGQPFGGYDFLFGASGTPGGYFLSTDYFSGRVTGGTVGDTGGTLDFTGLLSTQAAEFYGINPLAEMVGTFTIGIGLANFPGDSGQLYGGEIEADLAPNGVIVPEPASIAMVGIGLLAVVAYGRRAGLKSCKPGTPSK